jgi:glycosyltransferase 2 family protein
MPSKENALRAPKVPSPPPTGQPVWHAAVIAFLTIGLLWWAFKDINLGDAWRATVRAKWGWILVAIAVTIQTYVLRAWRWQVLLAPLGRASFRNAFRTTVIGFAANLLLPARAGEVLRPYLLSRVEPISAPSGFATIVVERLLDLVTVLLLFGVAMVFSGVEVSETVARAGALAAAGSLLGLVTLFLLAGHPERLGQWADLLATRLPARAGRIVGQLVRTLAEGLRVLRSPGHFALALIWSVPLWLSIALGIVLTSAAFGLSVPFVGSFLIVGYLTVGVMAPTPGAAGGFHGAYIIAMRQFFGAPDAELGAAAIVLHLVSFVPVTIIGLVYMWQDGLTIGRLRGLREDAEVAESRDATPDGRTP